MSARVFFAALLIASAPTMALADDSPSKGRGAAAEKKNIALSQKSSRASSDIRRPEGKQRRPYDDYVLKRGQNHAQGGRNPSPDD